MKELDKVKLETVKFMRGKYCLNEIGDGKNEIKFRQSNRTILSVYIYDDRYTFLIIFGKAEREKFDVKRSDFSQYILNYYDNARTLHDGKWMYIDVKTLDELDEVKRLIEIKKNPNRKPFSKEKAFYSLCGHRCDLCIHYTGDTVSEEFRKKLVEHSDHVYGNYDVSMRCSGCNTSGCHCYGEGGMCEQRQCARSKGFEACVDCMEYPCNKATAGYKGLEPKSISAEDVTWAILPYVPFQYEDDTMKNRKNHK